MNWVVELEPGVWLAPWEGDPGRTLVESSAKRFETMAAAALALTRARNSRPFPHAAINAAEASP
jgi:hypothetical protein